MPKFVILKSVQTPPESSIIFYTFLFALSLLGEQGAILQEHQTRTLQLVPFLTDGLLPISCLVTAGEHTPMSAPQILLEK